MEIIKALIDKISNKNDNGDKAVADARSKAEEAREITQKKITDMYTKINCCISRDGECTIAANHDISDCR